MVGGSLAPARGASPALDAAARARPPAHRRGRSALLAGTNSEEIRPKDIQCAWAMAYYACVHPSERACLIYVRSAEACWGQPRPATLGMAFDPRRFLLPARWLCQQHAH